MQRGSENPPTSQVQLDGPVGRGQLHEAQRSLASHFIPNYVAINVPTLGDATGHTSLPPFTSRVLLLVIDDKRNLLRATGRQRVRAFVSLMQRSAGISVGRTAFEDKVGEDGGILEVDVEPTVGSLRIDVEETAVLGVRSSSERNIRFDVPTV